MFDYVGRKDACGVRFYSGQQSVRREIGNQISTRTLFAEGLPMLDLFG
jgi:hypothetical protein